MSATMWVVLAGGWLFAAFFAVTTALALRWLHEMIAIAYEAVDEWRAAVERES